MIGPFCSLRTDPVLMLKPDPAVGWYAENAQIALADPTTDERVVTPKAALLKLCAEAVDGARETEAVCTTALNQGSDMFANGYLTDAE
ncbi:hypothetical protein AAFP30_05805 [Gordonia sp. CPCC 205515]|uniref:hypothetical protein n=1 Tax=Gordonia sp. CPCC 205515 TaxID=3140791 RepID=UPI003AF40A3E